MLGSGVGGLWNMLQLGLVEGNAGVGGSENNENSPAHLHGFTNRPTKNISFEKNRSHVLATLGLQCFFFLQLQS